MFRCSLTVALDDGDGVYRVQVEVDPGSPAHGPTYSCGGYPGDPMTVDVIPGPVVVSSREDDEGEPLPDLHVQWSDLTAEVRERIESAIDRMIEDGDPELEEM